MTQRTDMVGKATDPMCSCGLPMSRNPHPDAGKPYTLLETGFVWVCIPCQSKAFHAACERYRAAEQLLSQIAALTKARGGAS